MVLPYKSSCDAMELLLKNNKFDFINFKEYKIINIAGHDSKYRNNDLVKQEIKVCAESGQKTISLSHVCISVKGCYNQSLNIVKRLIYSETDEIEYLQMTGTQQKFGF